MPPGPPPKIPVLNSEFWQTTRAPREGDAPAAASIASIDFANADFEEERCESELGVGAVHLCGTEEPSLDPQAAVLEPSPPTGSTDSAPEAQAQFDGAGARIPLKEEPNTAQLWRSSHPCRPFSELFEAGAHTHTEPDIEAAPSAVKRSAPARPKVTEPCANASFTTEATQGDVDPASATPTRGRSGQVWGPGGEAGIPGEPRPRPIEDDADPADPRETKGVPTHFQQPNAVLPRKGCLSPSTSPTAKTSRAGPTRRRRRPWART